VLTSGPRLCSRGLMEIETSSGRRVTLDEHCRLVGIWSPHLNCVLGAVMTRWVPEVITAEAVIEYANSIQSKHIIKSLQDDSDIQDMWHVMVGVWINYLIERT
jgi:acyl CoA:acetate/3-ketoacid CoA transferase beta subunit